MMVRLSDGFSEDDIGNVGVGLVLLHEVNYLVVVDSTLFHAASPFPILAAVGEDHQLAPFQWLQLGGLQIAASPCRHPQVLRILTGADECRLLTLHDAHRLLGIVGQEVQPEEHLVGL